MSTPSHSTSRHHTEWLSLLEISGPFLSLEVLLAIFPQGLDADEPEVRRRLRLAYEEWKDNQLGLQPNPALHQAWVRYVLGEVLEMPAEVIAADSAIPTDLRFTVAEYQETLQPDLVILDPDDRHPRLLVQVLPLGQKLDRDLPGRHWKASPATRLMELLRATGVRLGLLTNGEQWMLVHAPNGETSGFISWYAELWLEEALTLRAWRSLLGVRRFFGVPEDETLEAMLLRSKDAQHEVTDQLGYQVRHAVEVLVQAIDLADRDAGNNLLARVSERVLYEAAVTLMMRLVFLFAAEERGLFPLDDEFYQRHYAASPLRAQLREAADTLGEEVIERRTDAWCRLLAVFRAIYGGIDHERLRLPAYGGGLFDPDRFPFLEGRASDSSWITAPARPLPVNNRTVLHVLEALQLLQVKTPGGERQARRLSFRALDIEQIGDVYEGLLDHTAVRASEPVLGLAGTRNSEPEVALAELEALSRRGESALLDFLKQATGRSSVNPLRKALQAQPDLAWAAKLRAAAGNDESLNRRLLPFAGLIRADEFGQPVVILPGSVYVTAGQERRATGTHYTPRSLTEPIVQHTLEPLVYIGPAEGRPRERWTLRPAAELLKLKVCDMAMGSGAFLVQVCRYLAERLVEAWETAEQARAGRPAKGGYLNVEGLVTPNANEALPGGSEERLILARRLVAERCLYGVDKNPLAVETAKLALWLITLDKGRAFSFLDHALKCGDSLVGVDLEQLRAWSLDGSGTPQFGTLDIDLDIHKMVELRRQIEDMPVVDIADQQIKGYLLADAEAIAHNLKAAGDMLVSSYYNTLKKGEQESLRSALLAAARDGADVEAKWRQHADLGELKPFHWPLEFPEVFLAEGRSGFDAIVGNPPFLGGSRISTIYGDAYYQYLRIAQPNIRGQADLCSMFFVRAFDLLQMPGNMGLLATKTISQGDTRESGVGYLLQRGAIIYRADSTRPWPGTATVIVSVIHMRKGEYEGTVTLNGCSVAEVTSYLDATTSQKEPLSLVQNSGVSFNGTKVYGLGFVLEAEEAQRLVRKDAANIDVLCPYLGGMDVNSRPDQSPSRWVINFHDWSIERAKGYPDCYEIVEAKVRPERAILKSRSAREKWWLYERPRPELYDAIRPLKRVLIISQATKYVTFSLLSVKGVVFDQALVLVASDSLLTFAVLNSSIHVHWAETYRSSLGTTTYYIPTKAFEPFPFPTSSDLEDVHDIGATYDQFRRGVMLDRWEGLTATYNHFHAPDETAADIARLRALHVEMDNAVAAAYGWADLDLGHGFHETPQGSRYTISEPARRSVLARLLELNHARYADEVKAGLHDKKKGKGKKGQATPDEQLELL